MNTGIPKLDCGAQMGRGGRWGVGGGEASWRGRIKDVEGCGVTLPHWRGWGSSAVK